MSKKISELTSAASITGTEEVPIVQSGETKKATVDLLRPPIATEITSSSTNTEVAGAKAVYDFQNKPRGRWVLNSEAFITPVSSYTQNLIKMVETITPDSSYFSYNATTGVWTFNKKGIYKVEIHTQLRGVNSNGSTLSSLTNCFAAKGFGIGNPQNLGESYINCSQQDDLASYSNLYLKYTYVATIGSTFCAEGYCQVKSGSAGTYKVALWGAERTSIDIELIEETT